MTPVVPVLVNNVPVSMMINMGASTDIMSNPSGQQSTDIMDEHSFKMSKRARRAAAVRVSSFLCQDHNPKGKPNHKVNKCQPSVDPLELDKEEEPLSVVANNMYKY